MNKKRITHFFIIRWLMPFLWVEDWKLRMRIFAGVFFIFVTILLNLGIPLIFKKVISVLATPESTPMHIALLLLLSYGLIWTLGQITQQLRELILFRTMERAIVSFSLAIFDHLLNLSFKFFLSRKTGTITSAIDKAHQAFPTIFWFVFLYIFPTMVEVLSAVIILGSLYSFSYGLVLFIILICYLVFSVVGMEWSIKSQQISNLKKYKVMGRVVDVLMNISTVKYFGTQQYEHVQTKAVFQDLEQASAQKHIHSGLIHLGQGIIIGIGLLSLTWLAGKAVLNGTMNVGDFVLVHGYLLQFVTPLSYFGTLFRDIRQSLTDMEQVVAIMLEEPEIKDSPNAITLKTDTAEVVFDNVKFYYDPRRPIIQGISFSVPVGKTVAIVGSTGSGKSTIAKLLFRFYDVTFGRILINGHDIRTIKQDSLKSLIGIVPQDTALFNESLYYNISYGWPEATRQEVEHVIKLAHLDSFIKDLPDGLETMVGERGFKLSGGEKQRIAIARLLLKQPAVYIFDEATSALDTQTEREIQKNLEEISTHATTIVIAHRLSTVQYADEIIVLDKGKIAERGTHDQLVAADGIYAKLWKKQQHQSK